MKLTSFEKAYLKGSIGPIKDAMMSESVTALDNQFIGTQWLGTCIGLGVVLNNSDGVQHRFVSHITDIVEARIDEFLQFVNSHLDAVSCDVVFASTESFQDMKNMTVREQKIVNYIKQALQKLKCDYTIKFSKSVFLRVDPDGKFYTQRNHRSVFNNDTQKNNRGLLLQRN